MSYTKEDAIYIAGFFDGEGCVSCAWNHREDKIKGFHLTIANTNKTQLEWLQSLFGGAITTKEHKDNKNKTSYWLQICGDNALNLICAILPHSKIKSRQLALAFSFFASKEKGRTTEANRFLYTELRRLNKRGPLEYIEGE